MVMRPDLELATPLIIDELRRLAGGYMSNERPGHTLQPTALVNEAFLRLAADRGEWQSRSHLVAIAAHHMRRILVDHARSRNAAKRGGESDPVTLKDDHAVAGGEMVDVLALDEALGRLGAMDGRKLKAVEMRFFGGMEMGEIAEVLGVHEKTIQNDLRFSRAWLRSELAGKSPGDSVESPRS